MAKHYLSTAMAIVVATLAGSTTSFAQSTNASETAINRASVPIKGQYIVVFKDTVRDPRAEVASLNRGGIMRVNHIYTSALKGFAAEIPDVVVNALRNNPRIDYIEQDQTVSINETQTGATWGLDRIDQDGLPLNQTYSYNYSGDGVTAYIIDTGILSTHTEFTGRMLSGVNYVRDKRGTTDCNGHGTHVAGTVGGKTYGVAKSVKLVPVRVLNCQGSGTWSAVIAGVDWVKTNAAGKPAVANMSLGGGAVDSLDTAVATAVAAGVVFVVAAGNSNDDACKYSPARASAAITVGSTTSADARSSFSNYGSCVDIFAPGSGITSAWYRSTTSTNTISGTSMASPHVAGAAALLLEKYKDSFTVNGTTNSIAEALVAESVSDKISTVGSGSPNKFLQITKLPPTQQ